MALTAVRPHGRHEIPLEFDHSGVSIQSDCRRADQREFPDGERFPHGLAVKVLFDLLPSGGVTARVGERDVRRVGPDLFRKGRIIRVDDGAAVQVEDVEQFLFCGGLVHDELLRVGNAVFEARWADAAARG